MQKKQTRNKSETSRSFHNKKVQLRPIIKKNCSPRSIERQKKFENHWHEKLNLLNTVISIESRGELKK